VTVSRRRRTRGQSIMEVALVLPLIILVTLGGTDLAQAYRFSADVAGASRAGMRTGIQGDNNDIGDAIRTEPNRVVQNTVAAWGNTATGGSEANCDGTGAAGTTCGNASGCPATAFTGTRQACFAVRACHMNSNQQCDGTYTAWGVRPESANGDNGLEVTVVYKFTPNTPLMAQFTAGGSFYLTSRTQGLELYY